MKKTLILVAMIFASVTIFAQNDADTTGPWKRSGLLSLTFNQASFSNWTAGGENSIAFTAVGKYFADYTRGNFSINNSINLKYGVLKLESDDNPRKSEDLIELISQFNQKFSKNWSATGQINFTSQFANGYNYPDDSTVISKFLSPAYLNVAPGLLYKPVDFFSILISPATMRGVIVTDQALADVGAYGVNPAEYEEQVNNGDTTRVKISDGENFKLKLGAFAEFYFKKDIKTDLSLESRLSLFYNYLEDNNIPDGTMPLDMNWQTFINFKINDWLSSNLFVHMAYMPGDVFIDREVMTGEEEPLPNDKLQILQTFGIGLAYNF